MRVLVDGDILVWKAALGAEHVAEWSPTMWTLHVNPEEACHVAEQMLGGWVRGSGASMSDPVLIAFSDPSGHYFRHDIYPAYKGNRKGRRAPLGYKAVRRHLEASYSTRWIPTLEGDDVLGIEATGGEDAVVISTDKDVLFQIPGLGWNPDKEERVMVTPAEAVRFHEMQSLTGDSTDGYPGCPGMGPKTATKFLAGLDKRGLNQHDRWLAILSAFNAKDRSDRLAVEQIRLAKILLSGEWTDAGVVLFRQPVDGKLMGS